MTEIKKTLIILKARWPEVALIIGINILSLLFDKLMLIYRNESVPMQGLIDLGYLLLILLILGILIVGFQRTVYLEGDKRQSPMVLLKTGMRFLGRMLRWGLLWLLAYLPLIWLTYSATKLFTSINAGFFETAQSSPLLYRLYFTLPGLILIKPLLLMPVIIIVLDCKVLESFKFLKRCKLFNAKELLILVLISTIFSFIWTILPKLNEALTTSQFILIVFSTVVMQFIGLMIAVTAVRFVASQNLAYDDHLRSADSQDLLKPLI